MKFHVPIFFYSYYNYTYSKMYKFIFISFNFFNSYALFTVLLTTIFIYIRMKKGDSGCLKRMANKFSIYISPNSIAVLVVEQTYIQHKLICFSVFKSLSVFFNLNQLIQILFYYKLILLIFFNLVIFESFAFMSIFQFIHILALLSIAMYEDFLAFILHTVDLKSFSQTLCEENIPKPLYVFIFGTFASTFFLF